MGQQQQPKVVDQAIAGMSQGLPEDSGIGMLPAPNMQSMASGGITGFSGEEGSLIRYGGPYGGKNLLPATTGYEGLGIADFLRKAGADISGMFPTEAGEDAKREAAYQEDLMRSYGPRAGTRQPSKAPVTQTDVSAATGNTPSQPTGRGGPAVGEVARYQATRNNQAGTSGSGIGRPPTAAAAAPDEDYLDQRKKALDKLGPPVDRLASERQSINDAEKQNARTSRDELDAEVAARGVAGKGQEERIAKREAGIIADRQTLKAFSFINAGLAMMQSKGRGLSGIAEGAMVGTKQYSEGMAKINLAQEKADEARDRLDEFRRNESTMDSRERRTANAAIRNLTVEGQKTMLKGLSEAMGVTEAAASAAVSADMGAKEKERDRASTELIARNRDATTRAGQQVRGSNAGAGMDLKGQRIQLDALKTQLASVNAALNNRNSMLDLPRNKGEKANLLAERQQLMADIARFGPPSSANPVAPVAPPAGSGKTIDFNAIK